MLGARRLPRRACARPGRPACRAAAHRPADLFEQRAAHDRRQRLVEEVNAPGLHLAGVAVAQREVELGIVEVGERVVRRDADVDVGVLALERLDARQQPERPERREGGDADPAATARTADLLHARVELAEPGLDRPQQGLAVGSDLDVARAAQEERRAELVLEALDLAADRRLRDVQLVGRGVEAEQPRHRLEGAQVAQRQRPAGPFIHTVSASMDQLGFIGFVA